MTGLFWSSRCRKRHSNTDVCQSLVTAIHLVRGVARVPGRMIIELAFPFVSMFFEPLVQLLELYGQHNDGLEIVSLIIDTFDDIAQTVMVCQCGLSCGFFLINVFIYSENNTCTTSYTIFTSLISETSDKDSMEMVSMIERRVEL